jgi:hypothetical protein
MERVVVEATTELLEQMEGKWTEPVRVMALRDPHAPTGWTMQIRTVEQPHIDADHPNHPRPPTPPTPTVAR